MNLLFVAYSLVQSEGGSLPIETLVKKINASKQFKKPDNSLITVTELTDLIQNYGKNIQVDFEGEVKTFFAPEKPISVLYWNIIEMLRSSKEQAEIAGITILFYARVSESPTFYPFGELRLSALSRFKSKANCKDHFIDELKKLNKHEFFNGKLKSAINSISNIEENILHEIFHRIDSFDISNHEIPVEDFAIQFQDLFLNVDRFSKSITYIPEFIREIISEMVISRPFKTIYNPVIGVGEVFTSIQSRLKNSSEIAFIGDSTFDIYGFTGTMNLILHQFQNFQISTNNPLVNPSVQPRSIDCVICQPPFGGQSSLNDWQLNVEYLRFGRSSKMEVLFLQFVLHVLNDKGRAYIILPEGFMFSEASTDKALRRYLLEEDYIDSVISLPAGAYEQSRIRTNILVIDKNKRRERRGKVLFFDTMSSWATLFDKALITDIAHGTAKQILDGSDHEMVRESVSIQEIIENNCRLQVSLYVNSYSKKIRNILAHNENVVKIREIISDTKFRAIATESDMPYIKGGDLSKDSTNPYLKVPDADYKSFSKVNGKVVDQSSVLVAKIGGSLNPTIFRFDGEPIVINQNVFVFPVNDNRIDIEYFALELNSELVKEQLKGILTGTAMQYYNYADLLNIQIRLPELSEQKKRVSVYQDQILAVKRKETQLLAEKMSSQEDEINILSAMKHSFAQLPFKSDLTNIETYIDKLITEGRVPSWNDPISSSAHSRLVREIFVGLNKQIDSTNELFQNMENLINCDPNKMNFEEIKVHDFIKQVISEIPDACDITVYFDGHNLPARVDKYQFREMIRNFIFNACRHGFTLGMNPKILWFETNFVEGEWYLKIFNNGNAFPDDFNFDDFIAFGKRKVASTGSGIGGYLINKVVTNHRGKISILEKPRQIFIEKKPLAGNEDAPIIAMKDGVEFYLQFPINFIANA
jgi:type I restriction enzyme M protein